MQSYGISEGSVYKGIKGKNTLIKHPDFALPGRKALLKNETDYEAVLIDATESPIERTKKAKAVLLWKEKETYVKDPVDSKQENAGSNIYGFFEWEAG